MLFRVRVAGFTATARLAVTMTMIIAAVAVVMSRHQRRMLSLDRHSVTALIRYSALYQCI